MSGRRVAALLPLVLLGAGAFAAEVPYLSGRVNDGAEILGAQARQELTGLLRDHETRTTNQVAVLTVSGLEGESIEEYASAVFKAWKLGRKDKDNGVLLLVAPSERRVRIEVGYGLEGTLTDLAAGRIIRNVITPRFKEGDLDRGVLEGVGAILAVLEGRAAAPEDASPPARSAERSEAFFDGPDLSLAERLLFGAFIFGIIGLFTVMGVLTPGVGWFLYFFLIPFWAMFPIAVVGVRGALTLLGTYLVAFPVAKVMLSRTSWYQRARKDLSTKGSARIGGFVLGGGGGGSSGSSFSSSSSSFSGGGGRSGGGGASGSW